MERIPAFGGITQTTISSWFRKDICPSVPSLEKICNAYNISLSQFFNWNNEPVCLSEKQHELLNNWSKLNEQQQNIILDLLKSM